MSENVEQSNGYLELTNVRKAFGQSAAVENFNLSVNHGEFITFLGPSGCGKTTTLRMIAGFERPTSGRIVINGVEVTNVPANKRKIGMVFQSYALFPNMTAAENIQFGLKVAGERPDAMHKRVTEMLELIHLPEIAKRYPHQLSGGQQQRVALARALAFQPQVLLLDEPLSALDAKIRVSLRQEIRSIQLELGITAIYVTHDQEEALSISDRIVVMSKGKIEQIGTPIEIYNAPATHFVASFVGTLNLLNAEVQSPDQKQITLDGECITVNDPIEMPVGTPLSVAIRPEAIRLNGHAKAEPNSLNGTLHDIYFLGSVIRLHVQLKQQFIHVDMFNDPAAMLPARGEGVSLSFMPDACRVFADANS